MGFLSSLLIGILLGAIQGVTEWLPVSSSGHLVAVQQGLGYEAPLLFDGLLHIASAAVVWFVFRRDIRRYWIALFLGFTRIKQMGFKKAFKYDRDSTLAFYVLLSILPTFLIGFFFYGPLESLFSSMVAVGIAAIATTVILSCSYFVRKGTKDWPDVPKAIAVGVAQGIAIVPGISRSGSTITAGMIMGMKREHAARYSIILAIPSLVGATAFVFLKELVVGGADWALDPIATISGMTVVLITGYLSINFLMLMVKKGSLHLFGIYTLVLGICLITAGMVYGL